MTKLSPARAAALALLAISLSAASRAAEVPFVREKLDNGLTVIYAPMGTAPVVHVRVLYHVGSRDERPDRQGFAHLFEHMMFRGSRHVKPEEHMKLIGVVGGESNAFTSFDQTTYVNTVPSNALQMALYLEADRMASFKVDDGIFKTERQVVAEEWRMRYANQPLGPINQDLLSTMYKQHSYRWTPIGDMDQLQQATSAELQTFFNTYYVPNNACLVICGQFDPAEAKKWVNDYFGWIPQGPTPPRDIPQEPKQTEPRRLVVEKPNVPLTNLRLGYKGPDYRSQDQAALLLLGDVLAGGRTGRLDRALVHSENPKCVSVGAGPWQLEDPAPFNVSAVVQRGQDAGEVERDIYAAIEKIKTEGVTAEELEKVKTQFRQGVIRSRDTCEEVAGQLAEEEVFGGDAGRVNRYIAEVDAVTPEQVQAVAKKYLVPEGLTVLVYQNGAGPSPATQAAKAERTASAPVAPSSQPIAPRVVEFPAGYPNSIPMSSEVIKTVFEKGSEADVNGMKVITLADHRLPLVNATLYFGKGSDADPIGKEGLASLTASMLRRGSAQLSTLDFSAELEARGISIEVQNADDHTQLKIDCASDQFDFAMQRAIMVLNSPNFDPQEFQKLKVQSLNGLAQSLASPGAVASRDLRQALYGASPLGRLVTPASLEAITLDDVRDWYHRNYRLGDAFFIFSGDLKSEQATHWATLFGNEMRSGKPDVAGVEYVPATAGPRVILVDNPQGRQATIRLAVPAFTIASDDKFAGSIAGQILSSGIDSRLGKYVRAEKGLTYGARAYFQPGRHGGEFSGSVDTRPETAGAAIEAMFKVFGDMRRENVTAEELAEAKRRVAGSMAMEAETIAQQANRRGTQILNGYPIDYYDVYPARIDRVTADQVRKVMNDYVKDDQMTIVVVAPADQVRDQLKAFGPVTELPMPAARKAVIQP